MVVKRGVIACCNVLFPPLAVFLLTGAGEDFVINSVLFLLAVIPSHIHGFYISMTYFNRKGKVRKGQYPGRWRPMIYSDKVQNGGATSSEVRKFKREREIEKYEKAARKKQGGRVRGFVRRITGRSKTNDYESSRSSEEYYSAAGEVKQPVLSRRQSSRIGMEAPRVSTRRSTRRRTSPFAAEVLDEPEMIQRHASIRSNGAYRNRYSQIDNSQQPSLPRRNSSVRRSQVVGNERRSHRLHDEEEIARRPVRRHTTYGRMSATGGSIGRNDETLADYVHRPALPARPGTSYRDDVHRWLQHVPVEPAR